VHESSRALREKYRTHRSQNPTTTTTTTSSTTTTTYRHAVADSIHAFRTQLLKQCGPGGREGGPKGEANTTTLPLPSRDPREPLCSDLEAAYSVPLVHWLRDLEHVGPSVGLHYTRSLIVQIAADCDLVLGVLEEELRGKTDTPRPTWKCFKTGEPRTIEYKKATRDHLDSAMKALYELRVSPETAAEECAAVVLYTLELLTDTK